jgi:hypothetical protein
MILANGCDSGNCYGYGISRLWHYAVSATGTLIVVQLSNIYTGAYPQNAIDLSLQWDNTIGLRLCSGNTGVLWTYTVI